jgi:subtilisin family serine protease
MNKLVSAMLALVFVLAAPATIAGAQVPSGRIVVHDESQLPRFAYPVTLAPSILVVADDATFAPFAAAVGADVEKTLRDYDLQDLSSLRDFIQTKLALQSLAHDGDGARATIAALRAAQSKADLKLTAARLTLVQLDAEAQAKAHAGSKPGDFVAALDQTAVNALPWDVVQDSIKGSYGREAYITKDAILGFVQHDLDPIAKKTGTLDGPSARALIQTRAQLLVTLPLFATDVTVLKAYIAQHNVVKPDIWAARDVTLRPAQVKAPVVIAIWDTGVDAADYPAQMYVDRAGRNGIAFKDDGTPSRSNLYPLPPDAMAQYPKYVGFMTGLSDLQTATDSPEADAFRTFARSMNPAQAAKFSRTLDYVGLYMHGSHVAGIASRGNPGAKIAVARFDDNLPDLTFAPTIAWAKRMAADFAAIGAYLRANHVRVVNMSWSDNVSEFEAWLAKTDKTADPQARKQRAQALYAIWRSAITSVIASTPGTLFVGAAGNADNNATFAAEVPASLSYPNLITVGAVNQAGDATSFTSYGPTVAVYADGFHVASKVPGGYTVKASGTSMASPNVANLAGKLFALDPSLTPVKVRALIVNGTTPSADGKRRLIDPQRSVALLRAGHN